MRSRMIKWKMQRTLISKKHNCNRYYTRGNKLVFDSFMVPTNRQNLNQSDIEFSFVLIKSIAK